MKEIVGQMTATTARMLSHAKTCVFAIAPLAHTILSPNIYGEIHICPPIHQALSSCLFRHDPSPG